MKDVSKSAIGRFYIAIDSTLKVKFLRSDNAYRYIDTKVQTVSTGNTNICTAKKADCFCQCFHMLLLGYNFPHNHL